MAPAWIVAPVSFNVIKVMREVSLSFLHSLISYQFPLLLEYKWEGGQQPRGLVIESVSKCFIKPFNACSVFFMDMFCISHSSCISHSRYISTPLHCLRGVQGWKFSSGFQLSPLPLEAREVCVTPASCAYACRRVHLRPVQLATCCSLSLLPFGGGSPKRT